MYILFKFTCNGQLVIGKVSQYFNSHEAFLEVLNEYFIKYVFFTLRYFFLSLT